jgi:organic radical activating enzyme
MAEGDFLEVCGNPWLTIQGEGPFAGYPAVFVRFAGCTLQCPGCDTDYTSYRRKVTAKQLANEIRAVSERSLVVFTGGEPFRQPRDKLMELYRLLAFRGRTVQIETNGTCLMEFGRRLYIVCSPKVHHPISVPSPWRKNLYWKYILRSGQVDDDGLPTKTLGLNSRPTRPSYDITLDHVLVQPLDEFNDTFNRLNVTAAVQSCLKFGYRLSLQTHKILGVV